LHRNEYMEYIFDIMISIENNYIKFYLIDYYK